MLAQLEENLREKDLEIAKQASELLCQQKLVDVCLNSIKQFDFEKLVDSDLDPKALEALNSAKDEASLELSKIKGNHTTQLEDLAKKQTQALADVESTHTQALSEMQQKIDELKTGFEEEQTLLQEKLQTANSSQEDLTQALEKAKLEQQSEVQALSEKLEACEAVRQELDK